MTTAVFVLGAVFGFVVSAKISRQTREVQRWQLEIQREQRLTAEAQHRAAILTQVNQSRRDARLVYVDDDYQVHLEDDA